MRPPANGKDWINRPAKQGLPLASGRREIPVFECLISTCLFMRLEAFVTHLNFARGCTAAGCEATPDGPVFIPTNSYGSTKACVSAEKTGTSRDRPLCIRRQIHIRQGRNGSEAFGQIRNCILIGLPQSKVLFNQSEVLANPACIEFDGLIAASDSLAVARDCGSVGCNIGLSQSYAG